MLRFFYFETHIVAFGWLLKSKLKNRKNKKKGYSIGNGDDIRRERISKKKLYSTGNGYDRRRERINIKKNVHSIGNDYDFRY